jgi:hypothetical protein
LLSLHDNAAAKHRRCVSLPAQASYLAGVVVTMDGASAPTVV